jgi:hypothetical protein
MLCPHLQYETQQYPNNTLGTPFIVQVVVVMNSFLISENYDVYMLLFYFNEPFLDVTFLPLKFSLKFLVNTPLCWHLNVICLFLCEPFKFPWSSYS